MVIYISMIVLTVAHFIAYFEETGEDLGISWLIYLGLAILWPIYWGVISGILTYEHDKNE
jgi:uncharacterized membrane protein (DUF441 family)